MKNPTTILSERFRAALGGAFGQEYGSIDPAIRRSQHADYQADVALQVASRVGKKPRDAAAAIVEKLDLAGVADDARIAGPGFVNVVLSRAFVEAALAEAYADERAGIERAKKTDVVVIDYSSPNVAKEMHVGHIRSTIIGDALARTLEFLGHRVIRQNHLGDWGTPFGMLIEELVDSASDASAISNLNALYRAARQKFDTDPAFAERARLRVVKLQSGDAVTLEQWRRLVERSRTDFEALYARLGVTLRDGDVRGESFYNPLLEDVVRELCDHKLAVESDGAICVFVPGFTNRDGAPLPLIVKKQDGGFGYAATDLAAIRFRTAELGATRLLYVVGAPQQQHLTMVFEAAKLAGWLDPARAEHVAFGSILGPDKKMFKTRSGETVRLSELLDEAEELARRAVEQKNPDLEPDVRNEVARTVGIGAIKYADLSSDRIKDYVFDWKRLLAFEGNTGPYLMYAHARICSILRKGEGEGMRLEPGPLVVETKEERALTLELLGLGTAIEQVSDTLQPHRLCGALYDLATAFTAFYENCPVLRAETPELVASRLRLSALSARALRIGLGLLGIEAPERM